MKIREIFYYYLRGTKFCPTAINSANSGCVNRIKPNKWVNASTYNNDKICYRLKQKAVECKECVYYDYYNNECMKDDKCNNTKFRQHESRDFQTKKKSEIWTSTNESNKI